MSSVYVLFLSENHEPDTLLGVYSAREGAEAAARKWFLENKDQAYGSHCRVIEAPVDGAPEWHTKALYEVSREG